MCKIDDFDDRGERERENNRDNFTSGLIRSCLNRGATIPSGY